ncbi:MAG: hypothetical protein ACJ8BC_18925 [Gemmatimonadales bacterium]
MARFDLAGQRLAKLFRYRERKDIGDIVYGGDTFLQEVRISGREGQRRTLSVRRDKIFVTLTVGRDEPLADVAQLLRTIADAIEYENLPGRSTQPLGCD